MFNDKANIRVPNPTMPQAISAGPGDAAIAKSEVRAKIPPPIDDVITVEISANNPRPWLLSGDEVAFFMSKDPFEQRQF